MSFLHWWIGRMLMHRYMPYCPHWAGTLRLLRARGQMRLDELERYAKVCRVQRVMRPYLEAIL